MFMTAPLICAKQDVVAFIKAGTRVFVGTNWCQVPQKECPRKDLPSGVGYDKCKDICKQNSHAEVEACVKAGKYAEEADMYIIGHTRSCDSCKEFMKKFGIRNVYFIKEGNITNG